MFDILKTDFYQVTMAFAYGVLDDANKSVGFEAFVRNIKPAVAGDSPYYIFSGENKIHEFMGRIREEVKNPILPYLIAGLISDKIKDNPKKDELIAKFLKNAKNFDTDFDYRIFPEKGRVFPYVPVFQYGGPIWIGQLIETYICNAINGITGYSTLLNRDLLYGKDNDEFAGRVVNALNLGENQYYNQINEDILRKRAKDFRASTSKTLLEACFRRAASQQYANMASMIALQEGWDGTSNLNLFFNKNFGIDKIGGTMAHSFIMSYRNEIEAFVKWNRVYPNSLILVDTYDTIDAVQFLIDAEIKPSIVRIDSDPLEEYARKVRAMLDNAKWNDVKIFLSGDLTPEILRDFENRKVPFDMCMAGTKYANINGLEHINAGFVYKIVEVYDDKGTFYPEKKANGKKNYPGLKKMNVRDNKLIVCNGSCNYGIANGDAEKMKSIESVEFNYPEVLK